MNYSNQIYYWAHMLDESFQSSHRDFAQLDDTTFIQPSLSDVREIYAELNLAVFDSALPEDYPIELVSDLHADFTACIDYANGTGSLQLNIAYKYTLKTLYCLVGHEMCHIYDDVINKTEYKAHATVHGRAFKQIERRLDQVGLEDYDNHVLNTSDINVKREINMVRIKYVMVRLQGSKYENAGGAVFKALSASIPSIMKRIRQTGSLDDDGICDVSWAKTLSVYQLDGFDKSAETFIDMPYSKIGRNPPKMYKFNWFEQNIKLAKTNEYQI